jgi:hypothetical protein
VPNSLVPVGRSTERPSLRARPWFVARNSSRSARRPAKPVASGCTSTWWLGKETVTEDQTVKGKARKERIDVDDGGGERRK